MTSAAAMKLSVPKVSDRAVAYCVPPLALRNSRCASKAQICTQHIVCSVLKRKSECKEQNRGAEAGKGGDVHDEEEARG